MVRQKAWLVLVAAAVAGAVWVGQAISQQQPPGRQRDPAAARRRMEEFRAQAAQRMRESLGATEEEWKVLQPKVEKVQTLQRQSRGGMRGMTGQPGRRGRAPGAPGAEAAPAREQTEVEKATESLRKVLDNKEAPAGDIKAALETLRQAREKAAQELAKAQKDLREVVTVRQEAQLVLMGLLD